MQIRNNGMRFGTVAQVLHWGMFAVFIALFVSAEIMQDLPKGEERWALYGFHKSLGVTALFLVFLRLSWRGLNPLPEGSGNHPAWQRSLAAAVHLLLYVVMLVMPLSGYVMSVAHGYGIEWFGLWELPDLVGKDEALAEQAKQLHIYSSYGLYALVGIHAGAAMWHQFVLKDGIMQRMLSVKNPLTD
ncbi:cytochrome b [Sedimenticola selenatireducens]|uniref:cytochrome b n=1 Tax=Sedimenticola selenatireducens TaxID=191960 RepID=UPI002AABACC4|nr:cytochrome b [Sedimenticola selenatireducens]